jgi:hypothetical protein
MAMWLKEKHAERDVLIQQLNSFMNVLFEFKKDDKLRFD